MDVKLATKFVADAERFLAEKRAKSEAARLKWEEEESMVRSAEWNLKRQMSSLEEAQREAAQKQVSHS